MTACCSTYGGVADRPFDLARVSEERAVHGDFVELAPQLPQAAVVTLDRVVCCYPFAEALLERALAHAEHAITVVSTRSLVRLRGDEFRQPEAAAAGSAFRTFVHSPALMERVIRDVGFELASRSRTWTWSADVYMHAAVGRPVG